jgi:CRISPR-associated protein Csx10
LQANDPKLAAFNAIFVNRSVARFGYLYPTTLPFADDAPASLPAPVTAFACKRHTDQHPLQDALESMLRGELRPVKCATCDARLERYRGFIGYRSGVPRRPLLRVGLNRLTEAAEDQALYVLEAVLPKVDSVSALAFTGYLEMTAEQWEQLQELLDRFFLPGDVAASWRLRIGSARARGLGEAMLRVKPANTASLDARLDDFQNIAPPDERLYFALTARAPLLLYEQSGETAMSLSTEVLRGYCVSLPAGLAVQGTFVEHEFASGWSQAWGLPKPVGPVIAAGSVFAYSVPKAERNSLLSFLRKIEEEGLGERRGAGFGELVACAPFHIAQAANSQATVVRPSSNKGDEL